MPESIPSLSPITYHQPAPTEPPGAPPTAAAASPAASPSKGGHELDRPALSQSVVQLVSSHSLLPKPSPECLDQAIDVVKGGGLLGVAAAGLLASGALGPVLGFIGASAFFAASLAKYTNCEEEAAQSKAGRTPR